MGVQRELAIGQIVLEVCYGGDLDAWRQKRAGVVSLRTLASHKDLRVSPGKLSRAIGVLELNGRIQLENLPNVTVSHLFEVIPLPSERQAALLAEVNTQALSVRALRTKLRAEADADTNGEPEVNDNPPVATAVRRLRRELRKPQTRASIAAMSDVGRERLDEMVEEVQSDLGGLRPVLSEARRAV